MGENAKFVLVTGGAGYIGSHTVLELLRTDRYLPVVVDNLFNSHPECLKRVEKLTGKKVAFQQLDLLDKEKTREVFRKYSFHAVIHFAGLKAVGESVREPIKYYRVNIDIMLNLLEVMKEFGVTNLLFSLRLPFMALLNISQLVRTTRLETAPILTARQRSSRRRF